MMEKHSEIMVSISMLTYNHENYISEALESILMQNVNFKYEIVIGEDCSTDNTRQILKEYKAKYPDKFKLLLHKKNIGMMANAKLALEACTGKYIATLEGDDYWTDPLKLQKQVLFLEENPEYVMTYTGVQAFNSKGDIQNYVGGVTRDLDSIELQQCLPVSSMTVCFRNVLEKIPEEALCSGVGDLFLWSLLGHYGKGKFLGDIKPSKYRVHEGGVFSMKSKKTRINMWLMTSNALYGYYKRVGNIELANYFLGRSIRASINLLGIFPILRTIMKNFFKF